MSWLECVRGWFGKKKAAHLITGEWGERQAARFLKKQGYKILHRNLRFSKTEELDIVMRGEDMLIFVEVKTRASEDRLRPAAAVNRDKRQSLRRAANTYLSRLKIVDRAKLIYRFDIVEVVGSPGMKGCPEIRHIKRAFKIHDRN